jgi:hypothetical protein
MQVGGAFGSGTSIGQGISGKNMFTGEDLSPGQRMFDLSFGAAGSALDLGGAGLTTQPLSKSFPTLTNGLTNQSKVNIFNRLNNGLSNESGAIRLGGGKDKTPGVPRKIEPEVSNTSAVRAGKIPGVDIPFRKVNPKYPADQDALREVKALQDIVRKEKNYDCSEIADDLLRATQGKGRIIEVLPSTKGEKLTLYEFGKTEKNMTYHQVYTDGKYIYDPRLSPDPVPKGDWEVMIRSLNPESTFKYLK